MSHLSQIEVDAGQSHSRICQLRSLFVFFVVAVSCTSRASAQLTSIATGSSASLTTDSGGVLEEVVVTAQRRDERLVDVPISISSVTGGKLQRDGISSLFDVAQEVPGLRFDAAGANIEPSIRGVGTLLTGPGLKPNVPIYVDGYYVPTELATNFQLLSISNIDVLKGPQGTLFGRNATGGAVLVRTLDPSFDPTLTARATYGSYERRDVSIYGSTPLTDTLAANVAGSWQRGHGYVNDINTGRDDDGAYENWEIRAKLLYKPQEALNFLLALDHTEIDDPAFVAWSAYEGLTSGSVFPGVKVATGPWNTAQGFVSSNREKVNSISLTARYDISIGTLSSYTQYRHDEAFEDFDSDVTAATVSRAIYAVYDNTFTEELNLASHRGAPFSWVAGLYFYRNDNVYNPYNVSLAGRPITEVFYTDNPSKSYAGYADATYAVVSHLFLTAGLRFTEDRISEHFNLLHVRTGSAADTFSNWSPRGVLRYELNDRSNVYGSYTAGYKSGALPSASFSTVPLRPENIHAYEIGYKYSGKTLQFETSAYYYDYKNLQVSAFTGFSSVDTNAAKSTIYGTDAHLTAQLTHELALNVGAAYGHAVYDDYPNASGYVQNLNPASSGYGLFNSSLVGSTGNTFNASGNTLPRAPRFTANVGLNYNHRFRGGMLELSATDYYTTRVYFDPINQFSQGAYSIVNLRATWSMPDQRWAFSLYGTNVTNEAYRNQVLPTSYAIKQSYGPPVQVGGSVIFRM
jgi:iron complex outermembrane receptor protein